MAILDAVKQVRRTRVVHEYGIQYKTMVGERGVTLSGGPEAAKLIARALLKDSAILIWMIQLLLSIPIQRSGA